MTFDQMIITWDMLGLIGDYCGKIADINMLSITKS